MDSKDKTSTKNLLEHARSCWGSTVVKMVDDRSTGPADARVLVQAKLTTGTLKTSFDIKGKHRVTYSAIQPTREETR